MRNELSIKFYRRDGRQDLKSSRAKQELIEKIFHTQTCSDPESFKLRLLLFPHSVPDLNCALRPSFEGQQSFSVATTSRRKSATVLSGCVVLELLSYSARQHENPKVLHCLRRTFESTPVSEAAREIRLNLEPWGTAVQLLLRCDSSSERLSRFKLLRSLILPKQLMLWTLLQELQTLTPQFGPFEKAHSSLAETKREFQESLEKILQHHLGKSVVVPKEHPVFEPAERSGPSHRASQPWERLKDILSLVSLTQPLQRDLNRLPIFKPLVRLLKKQQKLGSITRPLTRLQWIFLILRQAQVQTEVWSYWRLQKDRLKEDNNNDSEL